MMLAVRPVMLAVRLAMLAAAPRWSRRGPDGTGGPMMNAAGDVEYPAGGLRPRTGR